MVEIFIGLGSNVGDREDNLRKALSLLNEKMKILRVSSMYETEPMYMKDQEWFLNCVAKFETDLTPRELLDYLQDIEKRLGRKRDARYGPRNIDLDILFYGSKVVEEDEFRIPHLKIHERRFVLVPLAEIDPEYIHPIYQTTISALLANLNSNESVRKIDHSI
jgi:2-amino-4-hydroxy-6-hydroxymethyldihydropteridine diphosphokinase